MVYALHKFRNYLLGSHFKVYTNHSTLIYLVNKTVLGGKICIWLLLFQEYDFELIMKLGKLNSRPDHFSCILTGEDAGNLNDILSDAHLFRVQVVNDYFVDIVQLFSIGFTPLEFTIASKK
jgi:hypothetical protein